LSTDREIFEESVHVVQRYAPKFKVTAKKDSTIHKAIAWILRFPWIKGTEINKQYATDYWTTLGYTTAYPEESAPGDHYKSWETIFHEGVHAIQAKRYSSFLFSLLFLLGTPAIFILFALTCFPFFVWLPWWAGVIWLAVGALLSSPVPFGKFRAEVEAQAYEMTAMIWIWRDGKLPDRASEWIAEIFSGPSYFFMDPFPADIVQRIQGAKACAMTGEAFRDNRWGAYRLNCYNMLKAFGICKLQVPNL
jgi:hypothetical protein